MLHILDRKKDKVKQRRFGKSIGLSCAAAMLATAAIGLAPNAQAAAPAAGQPALATAIGDTVTKKCTTPGASYEVDSMYVVRKQTASSTWTYTITRSPNRYTYYTYTSGGTVPIYHRAEWIHRYMTSSSSTSYRYPGDKIVITSSRSGEDFRLVMSLTYSTWPNNPTTKICDIYF